MKTSVKLVLLALLVLFVVYITWRRAPVRNVLTQSSLKNIVKGQKPIYTKIPDLTVPSEVPSSIKVHVGEIHAELELTNSGNLLYNVNGSRIWSLTEPRKIVQCPQTEVLKNLQVQGSWSSPVNPGNVSLYLAPFLITVNDAPFWSLFGGSEKATSVNGGHVILMSDSRAHRAALMNNGDIVILTTLAQGTNFKTTVTNSLLTAWNS
jgi:hypothetical protein